MLFKILSERVIFPIIRYKYDFNSFSRFVSPGILPMTLITDVFIFWSVIKLNWELSISVKKLISTWSFALGLDEDAWDVIHFLTGFLLFNPGIQFLRLIKNFSLIKSGGYKITPIWKIALSNFAQLNLSKSNELTTRKPSRPISGLNMTSSIETVDSKNFFFYSSYRSELALEEWQ